MSFLLESLRNFGAAAFEMRIHKSKQASKSRRIGFTGSLTTWGLVSWSRRCVGTFGPASGP